MYPCTFPGHFASQGCLCDLSTDQNKRRQGALAPAGRHRKRSGTTARNKVRQGTRREADRTPGEPGPSDRNGREAGPRSISTGQSGERGRAQSPGNHQVRRAWLRRRPSSEGFPNPETSHKTANNEKEPSLPRACGQPGGTPKGCPPCERAPCSGPVPLSGRAG